MARQELVDFNQIAFANFFNDCEKLAKQKHFVSITEDEVLKAFENNISPEQFVNNLIQEYGSANC